MNNGFFKIYRELWDKPIWKQSTPIQKTVLLTLLSMVNFASAEWEWQGQKFSVQPGQTITSLQHIAERCGKGVNAGNVRGALDRFVKLGFLANESTKTGRLLTVVNWRTYQYLDDERCAADCKDLTKAMQSDCKGSASNKKNKKEEKDKKNNFYQNSSFTSFSQQAKPVLSAGAAQIRALAQGGCHE